MLSVGVNLWMGIYAGGAPSWVLRSGGQPATLDIDFAHRRSFRAGHQPSLEEILTVTRASVGTYTTRHGKVVLFGPDTLRLGDRGILVEESRQNIALRSQELGNAAWQGNLFGNWNEATVTANSTVAPDGTTTADTLTAAGAATARGQIISVSAGVTYTFTMYAQNVSGSGIRLQINSGLNGAMVTEAVAVTNIHTISRTEFTRVSLSYTVPGSGVNQLEVGIYFTAAGETIAWGAQLEAGAFPTSYIPTVASAVTRAFDNVQMTDISALDLSAGCFAVHGEGTSIGSVNDTHCYLALYNGITYTAGSGFLLRRSSTARTAGGNSTAVNVDVGLSDIIDKWAASWSVAGAIQRISGSDGDFANAADMDFTGVGTTTLQIGALQHPGNQPANSYIARITYFTGLKTEVEMEAILAPPAWLLDYEAELDFDFENDLGWLSGALVDLDTALTCARNHISYYTNRAGVLNTVPANTLRKGNRGLLVEEARTNLFLQSQVFDNASWSKRAGLTVTANTTVAPDGTTTADTASWASGDGYIWQDTDLANSTAYTISVYAKALSGTPSIKFNNFDGSAHVDSVVPLTADWVRYSYTFTTSASSPVGDTGFNIIDGDVALWGAQLEAGAFPTSYIPTTTVAVTRPAEVVSIATSAINYNQAAGTVYSEAVAKSPGAGNDREPFSINDGTLSERIQASYSVTNDVSVAVVTGGVVQVNTGVGTIVEDASLAIAFAPNDFAAWLNGAASVTDSVLSLPTPTTLNIGSRQNGSDSLNNYEQRFTYWRKRKPNYDLQFLTGGIPAWLLAPDATLDLDFVYDRAWVGSSEVSLASALTCTRASSGFYTNAAGTLVSIGSNTLRYGDNGLLVEEERTNLWLQSQTFGTTWALTRTTLSANAATAPDGTTTADALIEDNTASNNHFILQNPTVAANTQVAASVYVKRGSGTRHVAIQLVAQGGSDFIKAYYDLGAGTVGAQVQTGAGVIASASIETLAGGWFRCILVGTPSPSGSLTAGACSINMSSGTTNGSDAYNGDAASSLYLWGAQIEAAAFATSYIPTVAATVTRNFDDVSVGDLSFINQTEGTIILANGELFGTLTNNPILVGRRTNNENGLFTAFARYAGDWNGSVDVHTDHGESGAAKRASAYSPSGRAVAITNGAVATDTNIVGTINAFQIGAGGNKAQVGSGYYKRVTYIPKRKSNAFLQAIVDA